MIEVGENPGPAAVPAPAPQVAYRDDGVATLLAEPGTLAVFGFGRDAGAADDPRWLQVPLETLDGGAAPREVWQVAAPVRHGRDGAVRWSQGGGWLFAALELDEAEHGGPAGAAQAAYATLHAFLRRHPGLRVLRIWNYQGAINEGVGDAERYRQFCDGRAAGSGDFFAAGYPAATAIGHHAAPGLLQVYLLAGGAGHAIENPRQVSAWRYPREYGRTAPGFARAMLLPACDALAISGTAAVVGHASAHVGDVAAQLDEILANLEALLAEAGLPPDFDSLAPLKAYVRHPADAERIRDLLDARLPGVPVLLLHGDICRRELLVEIDGWRYA